MAIQASNFAYSTLAAGIASNATTITVATGHGVRFPTITGSDYCYLVLQDASNNFEVVKVTAHAVASDSMTVVRAQESTAARAWLLGDLVEQRPTVETVRGLIADLIATSNSLTATSATTATNLASGANGAIPYQTGSGTTAMLAAGTADFVLKANGAAAPSWVSQSTLKSGHLAAGAAGSIPYQSGVGITAFLAGGTAGSVLTTNGASAPTWTAQSSINAGQLGGIAASGYSQIAAAQTITGPKRGQIATANTGAFDMNASNNFSCTPSGPVTLTFSNITAGQSGFVILDNSSGQSVAKAASVKTPTDFLSLVSSAGVYRINYASTATAVYCTSTVALS